MAKPLATWTRLQKQIVLDDGTPRLVLDLGPMEIPAEEFVCILGPSGCGKTTLLAILGLVDSQYEGDLSIHLGEGEPVPLGKLPLRTRVRRAHQLRRSVGFIFQEIRLRMNASAIQNVIDPLIYLGYGTPESRKAQTSRLLTEIDLESEEHERRVSAFSGGMQQRTALVRALSTGPALICADEPTAHLDDLKADQIYEELKSHAAARRCSVIVVTHDEARARAHANTIIRFAPESDDEAELKRAVKAGRWPYLVTTERLSEPEQRPGSEVEPLTATSSWGSFKDMFWEAGREFSYVIPAIVSPPRRLFSKLTGDPRLIARVPSHLYMPILIAMVFFAMLSGTGFFFFSVQQAVLQYQEALLDELQIVKRVRVSGVSDRARDRVPLDGQDIAAYAERAGVPVVAFQPNYEQRGWALNELDRRALARDGTWSDALGGVIGGRPLSLDAEPDPDASRLTLNLLSLEPDDPIALDLGVGEAAFPEGSDSELPGLYIHANPMDWMNEGNLNEIPSPGDELQVLFISRLKLERPEPPPEIDPNQEPAVSGASPVPPPSLEPVWGRPLKEPLCVRFKISAHFQPRKTSKQDFVSRIQGAQVYHAAIRRATFEKILKWRHAPLEPDRQIPASWRCEGAPVMHAEARYTGHAIQTGLLAPSYDLFARTPLEALTLADVMEEYAKDRELVFEDVVTEEDFILSVSQIMEFVDKLGLILVVVPVGVGATLMWFVIHGIIQRRREQLLLFLVMGAPSWQIYLQCLLITGFIVVPALGAGYFIGAALPQWASPYLTGLGLPDAMLESLRVAHIGWEGLLQVGLLSIGLTAMVASLAVWGITRTNPADVFRGAA